MFLGFCYVVILQYLLNKLNERIDYDHGYKYLPFVLNFITVLFTVKGSLDFYLIIKLTLYVLLINIALIDLKYMEIPNTYNAAVAALGVLYIVSFKLFPHFLTGIISFVAFFILSVISGGAVGGGDIKLSFGLGLFFSLSAYINFIFYTFVTGAVISLLLLITKKKDKKSKIPFGPFMALGAILALL